MTQFKLNLLFLEISALIVRKKFNSLVFINIINDSKYFFINNKFLVFIKNNRLEIIRSKKKFLDNYIA